MLPGCSYFLVKTSKTLKPDEKPLPALSASKAELMERYNRLSSATQTMNMKVDFRLTGQDGKAKSGDKELQYYITDAYILVKRPSQIRIIGLLYKITAFDMVSDGTDFSIFVPKRNKLFFGPSNQKIGKVQDFSINLRPQHIFQALAMNPLQQDQDQDLVVEGDQEGRRSFYILYFMRRQAGGFSFNRKIWFDRFDLNMVRQKFFGPDGQVESDISYSDFRVIEGNSFPGQIVIRRPEDNFSLEIKVQSNKLNATIEDSRFVLNLPPEVVKVPLKPAEE
jgi:outer membrane lipoprotein-sorting protein